MDSNHHHHHGSQMIHQPHHHHHLHLNNNNNNNNNIPSHITDPFDWQETFTFGTICAAVFFYFNVIFHNRFSPKFGKDECGARVISLIHAVVSAILSIVAMLLHRGAEWGSPATRLEGHVAMLSFAYFFVDSVIMIIWKFDLMFLVHHIVALRWLSLAAIQGQIGYGGVAGLLAAEVTNPLMHGRWLCHAYANSNTQLCKWMTRLFFPTFFIARIVVIPGLIVMNYDILPTDILVILGIFSAGSVKFLIDTVRAELKGEWWEG